jgi:hypothetical protein
MAVMSLATPVYGSLHFMLLAERAFCSVVPSDGRTLLQTSAGSGQVPEITQRSSEYSFPGFRLLTCSYS